MEPARTPDVLVIHRRAEEAHGDARKQRDDEDDSGQAA
jgi:hypothetical protein